MNTENELEIKRPKAMIGDTVWIVTQIFCEQYVPTLFMAKIVSFKADKYTDNSYDYEVKEYGSDAIYPIDHRFVYVDFNSAWKDFCIRLKHRPKNEN